MKTVFLVAGVVLSVVSLVVLGLTSFVPDFVVAIYNGEEGKSCQVANVGAFTSDWTPDCSKEIGAGVSGVEFSSPTTEFWPLFPLMNPEAEGNPLNGVIGDFTTCEESLDQLDAVVVAKVSSLVNATADSVGMTEEQIEGALWEALSPLQNIVAGTEAANIPGNGMAGGAIVGLQLTVYAAIFQGLSVELGAAFPVFLNNATLVGGAIAETKAQIEQVYAVTAPCFCAAELDESYIALGTAGVQGQDYTNALKFVFDVYDEVIEQVINPCTAEAAVARASLIPDAPLVVETALDTCFERFALNVVAPTSYQGVFNSVDAINRTEAERQCDNDIKDIEALELAQTLLTVAVAIGGLTIVVGVVALVMQSVTALAIVALILSIVGAGVTMYALLTVKGAPVYENVGVKGCVTCYEGSSGTTMGFAAIGVPVVAGVCYGISLAFQAGEASEDEQGLVASEK